MLHFLALQKSAQNLLLVSRLLYIVMGTCCNYEFIFIIVMTFRVSICCYDIHVYNGSYSDCGFNLLIL